MDWLCIFWIIQNGGAQGVYALQGSQSLLSIYLMKLEHRYCMCLHGNANKEPIERLPCEILLQIL